MLKNENVICISSIDWDFIWQGHQEIMSTFARNGNRVIFIENTGIRTPTINDIPRIKKRVLNWFRSTKGFRKETDNLFIYSPIALPFPYSKIARWINRKMMLNPLKQWMKAMDFHDVIMWTFLPTGIALDIINELDKKLLIYYYIADFNALADRPAKLRRTEESLFKKCDLVFAQNEELAENCKKINPNVHIFPFGVNTKMFEDFLSRTPKKSPKELENIKGPVIGYVGGLHKHIDLTLLKYLAQAHPDWSIVLLGPKQADISLIEKIQNIIFLGQKDFSDLPQYIFRFDVCIIPYLISDYTKTVYPTKLNEYHIMGKPVVSTNLPEVRAFNEVNNNIVAIAGSNEEFAAHITEALDSDDRNLAVKRAESARKNNWSERIEDMSSLIEAAIKKNKSASYSNWQEKFLLFYKGARTNTIRIFTAFLMSWLLVFYTPIVWYLAEPLKISNLPEKADAIVVLAGGVGESGKAKQGYEERVKYAVELYKKKYAGHLVFSSGYTQFFQETLLMKALAVALGVPQEAIVLEDKASNTYENIKFTKNILDKEEWKKVLLVSSPYHMRRVSMVINKIANDIKVSYLPLPQSSFYRQEKGVFKQKINYDQIRGIFHEYAGIVYYYFKGYI